MKKFCTWVSLLLITCSFFAGTAYAKGNAAKAADPAQDRRNARGLLGLVGTDHVGLTVPDINEAISWFETNMGCSAPLTFGPFADPVGTFMQDLLDVDPKAVINQITQIRCGNSASIELFEYVAPDQVQAHPRNSDWGGHHIAFYVTDMNLAVSDLVSKGVEKFLGPLPVDAGPAAGQTINYFRTPFGTYIELISYPEGMAYEADPSRPLWSPKRNKAEPASTNVPGLLGMDHVGITVPDIEEAIAWFEDVLGCHAPLTFGPFSDPEGTFMQDLLDVDPKAVINQITMLRCGNGPNVELFEYEAPDQEQTHPKNSDWGGHHIAFYVRDINKAVDYMSSRGVQKFLGPLTVGGGPAAGQSINYFRAPFGTYIELISYPKGMAYEETALTPLWNPRKNRP